MGEWRECTLGDAPLEIIDGDRGKNYPKKGEFFGDGFCLFLNTKNVTTEGFNFAELNFITKEKDKLLRKGKLKRSDLVLTTRGTVGNVGFYNENVNFEHIRINSGMVIIRPAGIDDRFNYHLFKFLKKDFDVYSTGSAQPQLPIRDLNEIAILLPPLPEQKAIASVLSSLDDKIDLLHRQNKTLEAMAETLFRQWFVEEAQEEWEEGVLGDIADFNPSYKLTKGDMATYLEMSNVSNSTFNPQTWARREFTSGMKFQSGDTLLARITPCLENGKTCFVSFLNDGEIGWGSTEYIVIRMKKPFHPFISYIIAKDKDFRYFAISSMSGSSGRQRAQADVIKEYDLKIPPEPIIKGLNSQLAGIVPKLVMNSNQILILEKLRDTLLPKLMSGDVRVEYQN